MVEEAISFWTEIQRFEDMLAADPRSLSFAPLSELYRKLGLLDDAISVARKGCELHPDYPGGLFALGHALFDKGHKDEARSALERVVLLNPENLRAQKLLGQLYVEAGETALARQALGEVLEQNPEDAESALLLRSIASAGCGAPEEEDLEELEVIEELTELVEEPQEPADVLPSAVPEEASSSEESAFTEIPELPEFPAIPPAPATPAPSAAPVPVQHPSRDPLTTATLAELYVSQGFLDKAIAIYQELLGADPGNHGYRLRCTELKSVRERQLEAGSGAAPVSPLEADELPEQAEETPGNDAEAELSRWLENIRRRRNGV
jgi:tetratricopeptide (TPR) repeat protein